jgi:AbrB family looped-hinge helix DNA binding protein
MVSTKGQVTIPAAMREKYDIKAGDVVIWEDSDDRLALKKTVDFFSLRGCLGKVEIPEDEEELFIDAVTDHVMKDL